MTDFVIVVDVNHKRAQKAYAKGLRELAELWPQVELYCAIEGEKLRKAAEEESAAELRKEAERRARRDAELKAYEAREAEREAWRSATPFFRGECPPSLPYPFSDGHAYWVSKPIRARPEAPMEFFNSIKAELQRMSDIACAATGPYRMPEHKVYRMVEWENGEAIERIRLRMKTEWPPYWSL